MGVATMKECIIQIEYAADLAIVQLNGSLDAYSFPRLESMLNELREKNRYQVILDCTTLDYVSSAALGALIGFARKVRQNGGDLKLAKLSKRIYTIVELLGFHKIVEIYPTVEQAAAKFGIVMGP